MTTRRSRCMTPLRRVILFLVALCVLLVSLNALSQLAQLVKF